MLLLSYWLLLCRPEPHAANAEIVSFYGSGDSRLTVHVGLYLMPFAGIAFLWFMSLCGRDAVSLETAPLVVAEDDAIRACARMLAPFVEGTMACHRMEARDLSYVTVTISPIAKLNIKHQPK